MWIMSDTGFISIVQHRDDPSVLLVRARVKEDITGVLGPDIEVTEMPGADYLYRANVSRQHVAAAIAKKLLDLDYDSHAKDVAIERSAPAEGRSRAYYAMWSAMAAIQPYAPYSKFPRTKWTRTTTTTKETTLPLWDDYDLYGDVQAARRPGQWWWDETDTPLFSDADPTNLSTWASPRRKKGKKNRKGGRK